MLGQKLTKVNASRPIEWACRELSAKELVAVSGGLSPIYYPPGSPGSGVEVGTPRDLSGTSHSPV